MTKLFLPPMTTPVAKNKNVLGEKSGAVSVLTNYIPAGIANTKKLVFGGVFSENGTKENRQNGNYAVPGDGISDKFRDAMGKYWTYTSNEKKEITFLSPEIMEDSEGLEGKFPASIYFESPVLIDDQVWTEQEQTFYVTPYNEWVSDIFAGSYFDKIRQEALSKMSAYESEADTEAAIQNYIQENVNPEDFMTLVSEWWASTTANDFPETYGQFGKACVGLLNDAGISDAANLCKPWIVKNQTFIDHALDIFLPLEIRSNEQDQTNIGVKFPYYSLDSEYNFYISKYEEVLKNNAIVEQLLPNLHIFVSSFAPGSLTGEKSDYNKYKKLITLDGILEDFDSNALKITSKSVLESGDLKQPPASSRQYFSYWSNKLQNTLSRNPKKANQLASTVGPKCNLVMFPMQDVDILNNYNDQKYMFPMYNELAFSTGVQNVVGDMLRQTRLSNNFMKFYASVTNEKLLGTQQSNAGLAGGTSTANTNPIVASAPFVSETKSLSLGETVNGTKVVNSSSNIAKTSIDLVDIEAFLATLNINDLMNSEKSNLNLTPEQIQQISNFLNNNEALNNLFNENTTFVTKDDNEEFALTRPSNAMHRSMLCVMMLGKLRKLAKENVRPYSDIMLGKTNYSETIMYIVNKRKVNTASDFDNVNPILQSFYFLNSSETDVLTFIDTQVHYDVVYQYDIEAIVLSVGTSYQYISSEFLPKTVVSEKGKTAAEALKKTKKKSKDLQDAKKYSKGIKFNGATNPMYSEGDSRGSTITTTRAEIDATALASSLPEDEFVDSVLGSSPILVEGKEIAATALTTKITVRSKPNCQLLKVPYASIKGRVLDKPPIFPDALITPYKGQNNKVLITLNQNVGEYYMKPIIINAEEQEQYQKMLEAQKITENDQDNPPIEYKADDAVARDGYFEVYRMSRKPRLYSDFKDKLVTIIRGYHELEVGHMDVNSVALRDTIQPNRKYYYMFRVVDVHGHVSNPSPVFEVELVDDNGTVYMIQKIVEFAKPNNKTTNKDVKKYIQIKPTFEQSLLNVPPSASPLPSAFDYGKIGTQGDINLGMVPTKIWGKKFKIRLTSKSSGKQIDLNVTFTRSEENKQAENAKGKYYSDPRP